MPSPTGAVGCVEMGSTVGGNVAVGDTGAAAHCTSEA
jgi:hypothetical protein